MVALNRYMLALAAFDKSKRKGEKRWACLEVDLGMMSASDTTYIDRSE